MSETEDDIDDTVEFDQEFEGMVSVDLCNTKLA